jgi:hypothetical protein
MYLSGGRMFQNGPAKVLAQRLQYASRNASGHVCQELSVYLDELHKTSRV